MNYRENTVSVIIPCYNGKNFIHQSFSHILKQTYQKLEILFVDDGSTDNSFQEALNWKNRFNQVGMELVCLQKENGGAASAVNLALKKMTGEFFMLLDIDDFIYPENIRKKLEYLQEHSEIAFVRSDGEIYNEQQGKVVSDFSVSADEKKCTNIFRALLFGRTYNWTGSYLIRSEIFHQVNGGLRIYESRYGQNMQILLPVAARYDCGYVPDCAARYIEYASSVSHSEEYQKNIELMNGYEDIRVQTLKQHCLDDPELTRELKEFYLRQKMSIAYHFHEKEAARGFYLQIEKKTIKDHILEFRCQSAMFERCFQICVKLFHRK